MAGSSGRFALHVVLFSVITAVGAVVLVSGIGLIRVLADQGTRARATAEVEGRVVDGYQPPDEKALVQWLDEQGAEQLTWFTLDEPAQWAPGRPFRLRYDPAEGGPPEESGPFKVQLPAERTNVVSAEAGAHNSDHAAGWDYWWPTAVIGGVASLVLLAWAARGRLNRMAAAAPPVQMRVVVVRGRSTAAGTKDSVALLLASPETPLEPDEQPLPRVLPGTRWQRVYWHPALEQLTPGQTVTARIKHGFGGRAVIEPRPNVQIWPAGGLRGKSHRGIGYTVQRSRSQARHVEPLRPPPVVWFVPVVAGVLGAARGHLLADAPVIILGLVVITTFLWAWYTPAPAA